MTGALVVGLVPSTGAADELDDRRRAAQERANTAQQRSEELRASIEGLSADLGQAVADLAATEARLPAAQEQLRLAQDELQAAERRALMLQTRLTDATNEQVAIGEEIATMATREDEVRASVGQLARQAYMDGGQASTLAVVLDAQDLQEFTQAMQATATAQRLQTRVLDELTTMGAAARNAEARLAAVTDQIAELKVEADVEVARADEARVEAAAREDEIETLIAQQQATQQRLAGMKAQAEAEQAEADRQRAALEDELAAIIAEQQRAAAATPDRPAAPPPSSSTGAIFANPTSINPMYVTSNYGMRLHPILGYERLHAGIDLRTYCNTPLYAPRDATVQWAQWRNGFGNQVMLNYGSVNGQPLMSSSNHMTSFTVSTGQQVNQGDLIGYSGNTGLSTACHLHFEVYQNGSTINPAPLLGR
ncbi:M23 family metallopeptidase [Cellulomonas sp. C5510]|uniref:peptidoglycan DD-metalloendopeptidase family protein n=1 Tax=Cellulomonas sp. C5510 TaxID=2871170 RepID=UPI0021083971|nr:M23 family metallopeptidase [Cellulomonas sp. C5510]